MKFFVTTVFLFVFCLFFFSEFFLEFNQPSSLTPSVLDFGDNLTTALLFSKKRKLAGHLKRKKIQLFHTPILLKKKVTKKKEIIIVLEYFSIEWI